MAGGINRLNNLAVERWRKMGKSRTPKKLFDGDGLFLALTPKGTPVWRLRFRIGEKDKTLAIGEYPEISIKAARAERDAARTLLRANRDPVHDRQLRKAESAGAADMTFAKAAEAWLAKSRSGWSSATYQTTEAALERDVLGPLGRLPVALISPAMVANVIETIVKREAIDTARKTHFTVRSVFRYAQARGWCRDNPADPAAEIIPKRRDKSRRPALLTWAELGAVLRGARLASLSRAVHMAHRLCAFTAARMGNIIAAEWSEFDLESEPARWVIPRTKMKMRDRHHDHIAILGTSIAAEIREWRSLSGSKKGYLFPALPPADPSTEHITHESIEKAYRVSLKLAGKHTPHGWRAALSTLAKDAGFERDAVEMALDHVHDTEVVRAYDRGDRLPERIRLAQWWCKQLTAAERGEP